MELTKEQKFYAEIVQKAWDDAEFKNELIADPLKAIESFTGKKLKLPDGKKIVVKDQTDESTVFINIPANTLKDEAELTEEQLENVAGGGILGATIGGAIGALGGPLGVIAGAAAGHAIEELLS